MKTGLVLALVCLLVYACGSETNTANPLREYHLQLLKKLEQAVARYPDSASVRMQYINTLDSLQMYKEALAQTDSMIKRDSLNNGLWFARAQLSESLNDTVRAITDYEKALRIYPSVDAQLSLANLFAETKNANALAICQNVSRMSLGRETDANCDFIAGVYHARTGATKKALAFFDRAINNNYTLMEAYMEKGFIYFGQDNHAEAMKVFETAITVNNTYADAYYWKAKTYEAMGNKEQALLNYERSLGLDRTLKEAAMAIKRLQ